MSDINIPTGGTVPSTPPTDPPVDNAAFARMRQALEAEKAAATARQQEIDVIKAELKKHQDASKTELERLQEAAKDADKLRDENGRFASATQALYEKALEAVPAEKKDAVTLLSSNGNYAERLTALNAAVALIGAPAPVANVGTSTAPATGAQAGGTSTPPTMPKTFEEISKFSWGDALSAHPVVMPPDLSKG